MAYGILRIKPITQGGIGHIGAEEDRRSRSQRNGDIDPDRSHLNMGAYRLENQTLYAAWKNRCAELGVSPTRKGQICMEQAVVTASPAFFRELGWDKEAAKNWHVQDIPADIIRYFEQAAKWLGGYLGERNIISITLHLDEETPHMHVDYIPVAVAGKRRKDVYARDADGRILRDGKGHAIRAKDEAGHVIYEYVDAPVRLNRSDFWQERGGRQSYRQMQDAFYQAVSKAWGLERGEIATGRQHIEQERHKARTAAKQVKVLQAARDMLTHGNLQLAERIVAQERSQERPR